MEKKVYGILLAGGSGSRMGASVNKVLLPVAGIPCIARSALAIAPFVDHLVLVYRMEDETALRTAISGVPLSCPISYTQGGKTRQESVHKGLQAISDMVGKNVYVIIHDGARCLVDHATIMRVINSIRNNGTGAAAVSVVDTLRFESQNGQAGETVPRDSLRVMQTPQGADLYTLVKSFSIAEKEGYTGTDDVSVLSYAGIPVYFTRGNKMNFKITTQEDLTMAELLLSVPFSPIIHVGHGYDVHQLAADRKLILCGVEIPHTMGLLGHSDADVALHALMDALLGAAGLGDIGTHFPDTDSKFKDISSMLLLSEVMEKLSSHGFIPVNVDITIVAQKPKLAPFIPIMKEKLAETLHLDVSNVNIKATTTEWLGFEGRMEGISAQAVCLIQSVSSSPAT